MIQHSTASIFVSLALLVCSHLALCLHQYDTHSIEMIVGSSDRELINGAYGIIKFKLEDNWKTYWKNPGTAGLPLKIELLNSSNVKSIEVLWPTPAVIELQEGYYSNGYEKEIDIPFFIAIDRADRPASLQVLASYAVCNDVCIPYSYSDSFEIDDARRSREIDRQISRAIEQLPIASEGITVQVKINANHLEFSVPNTLKITDAFIQHNPEKPTGKPMMSTDNKVIIPFESELDWSIDDFYELVTRTSAKSQRAYAFTEFELVSSSGSSGIANSFIGILLFAFLGGLILNFMPCVLPVLALKVASARTKNSRLSAHSQIFYTCFGILLSFMLFTSVLLFLRSADFVIGWGFHFQYPSFVIIMLACLIFLTLLQLGVVELKSASTTANKLNVFIAAISTDNRVHHILYGFLIMLLATPCTAPFLGTAVTFALAQDAVTTYAIFATIAAGLSTPMLASVYLKFELPKSSPINKYIQAFAISLIFMSSIWVAYVLATQIGMIAASLVYISILLILYLSNYLRGKRRYLLPIFVVAMMTAIGSQWEKPTNPLENDLIEWHTVGFQEEIIQQKLEEYELIYLHITADWCLTCKFNEHNVIASQDLTRFLHSDKVYLIKVDITLPDEDAMRFIQTHNRQGIPFDIVLRKNGTHVLLPEILTVKSMQDALTVKINKK